ncbi:MAG: magnesium protoporphyrin IX methyltransferase [Proteobacteria bacterium]|nr:magnesium protoporphyrin IX methyltransferase [Pseudomonadota bacterium]
MDSATYIERRGKIEAYFDRTAAEAWKRLTSDAPVGRVRATVRAGRDRMRGTILDWLPRDLDGRRVLDAGCGTGALAVELARRGAHVVAIDLSPTLTGLARDRSAGTGLKGSVEFRVGDMLDPALGTFDHVVAMDSLIHYRASDMAGAVAGLARRTGESLLFTFAPRTPMLSLMHAVGRCLPGTDRAPAIEPISYRDIRGRLTSSSSSHRSRPARTSRVASGFYVSQLMEVVRA